MLYSSYEVKGAFVTMQKTLAFLCTVFETIRKKHKKGVKKLPFWTGFLYFLCYNEKLYFFLCCTLVHSLYSFELLNVFIQCMTNYEKEYFLKPFLVSAPSSAYTCLIWDIKHKFMFFFFTFWWNGPFEKINFLAAKSVKKIFLI